MFSKALFKQSCKANGAMWLIITVAVCFMLACVMMISGGGNLGEVKDAIEDTIIQSEIDSAMEQRAINYYMLADDGLTQFDGYFSDALTDVSTYGAYYAAWYAQQPTVESVGAENYAAAMEAWQEQMPEAQTDAAALYLSGITDWMEQQPQTDGYASTEAYMAAMTQWQADSPVTAEAAATAAYTVSVQELQDYLYVEALDTDPSYNADSNGAKEILAVVLYALNPAGQFDDFYTDNGEPAPEAYDVTSLAAHLQAGDLENYLTGEERGAYVTARAEDCAAIFLAGNMTQDESVNQMLDALSEYGVSEEKYQTFGYTYENLKESSMTAILTFQSRYDYALDELSQQYADGGYADENAYEAAVTDMTDSLTQDITGTLLSTLPQEVSDGLEELGKLDMYSLIVGNVFYKMAGLLLPIIYMIMAANNLIAGQVDSGSMAYVLSTSTKRRQVTFTQAVYLIGSLLAMFACTSVTGLICLSRLDHSVITMTNAELLLLNLGAFLVLFALSGVCFFASCWFNRSKYSMSLGGGLSMFALVSTMLGLFGSEIIPSVIRLDALNNFNYVTIITLFDAVSIIDGTNDYLWKLVILTAIGLVGYVVGAVRFRTKDLPL